MKVTLEYDGWDERTEALQAQHATDYMVAIDRIRQEIHRRWRWIERESGEARRLIDEIHDFVEELIAELPEYDV